MKRVVTWLMFAAWSLPAISWADQAPAKGRLLVATEVVGGFFDETVVLLLRFDETGAVGIVVNRPTDVELDEILDDAADGKIYWGGPVQMNSLRALSKSDVPIDGAEHIVESIYIVPVDDALEGATDDTSHLRFFIGYAGWSPGQLEAEMARGSWLVVPASDEFVFAPDPGLLWIRLAPQPEHRAALMPVNSEM